MLAISLSKNRADSVYFLIRILGPLALAASLTASGLAQQPDSGQQPTSAPTHAPNDSPGASSANDDQSMQRMHRDRDSGMNMTPQAELSLPSPHAGSGTGWQPVSVPAYIWMTAKSGWDLMAHGTIFITFNDQGGPRGEGKAESVNYLMTMEQHRLGRGTLLLRQMFSAESLTSPHPGFPELFQTGETFHGQPLVDHQHPHNVFAELSAYYTLPVTEKISWLLYGGPAAEPALGPVTYIHRASASENPAAPLGHHLQDSTHTSFGVVTTGFVVGRVKVEGSAFNGREPNEQRWSIQTAPWDSWSFRVSAAPTRNWAAQYSYGRLMHPEAQEPGNEKRQTASVSYNRLLSSGNWATTVVWARKHKEINGTNQNSYLLESTLNFLRRNYGYTRLELVDKDELFPAALTHPSFRIGAYTFGGVRDLLQGRVGQLGLGADVTFYSKPAILASFYGSNPVSFRIFLRLRPGLSQHGH
jgi:hypothetical protein